MGRDGIDALGISSRRRSEVAASKRPTRVRRSCRTLPRCPPNSGVHYRPGPLGPSPTSPATSGRARSCSTTTPSATDRSIGATPEVEPFADSGGHEEVRAWLEEVHARFAQHVAALGDDAELDTERLTNWSERRPTRWIIASMITHDAYHAGEINHLRSILGPDDRWRHVQLGFS